MPKRAKNPRKKIAVHAEVLHNLASNLYVHSYSKGVIDARTLHQALIKAKRALLLAPHEYDYLILVARVFSDFEDKGSQSQALKYYERAIALRPDRPDAYEDKAHLLMNWLEPPDPDGAERLARKALKLSLHDDEDPETLALTFSTLIGILEVRRKFDETRWVIRQALRKCPTELMRALGEGTLKRISDSTNPQVPEVQ